MSNEQYRPYRTVPPIPPSSNATQASSYAPRPSTADGSSCRSSNHLQEHRRRIAEVAYLLAERRGFRGGDQLQDWLEAERVVCGQAEQEMERR